MDPTIIASIISGGSSLVGGIGSTMMGVNAGANMSQTDRNFAEYMTYINQAYQTSERLAAQQYATDMWNMSNEYNSPAAQLERARLAGINPNAVIAGMNGGVAAHPVSSTGQSGGISGYSSGLGSSIIGAYQNMGKQIGEAGLLAADVRKKNAEANNIDANTDRTNKLTPLEEQRFKAETQKFFREIKHIDFSEKEQAALNEWTKALDKAKISEINENLNNIRNEALLRAEQIVTEQKKQGLLEEQTANVHQKTENDKVQHKILEEIFEQEQVKAQVSQATGVPIGAPAWYAMFSLWKSGNSGRYLDIAKVALYSAHEKNDTLFNPIIHGAGAHHLVNKGIDVARDVVDYYDRTDPYRFKEDYSKNRVVDYVWDKDKKESRTTFADGRVLIEYYDVKAHRLKFKTIYPEKTDKK